MVVRLVEHECYIVLNTSRLAATVFWIVCTTLRPTYTSADCLRAHPQAYMLNDRFLTVSCISGSPKELMVPIIGSFPSFVVLAVRELSLYCTDGQ